MNINERFVRTLSEDIRAGLLSVKVVLEVLTEQYTISELEHILGLLDDLGYKDIIDLLIMEKCKKNEERQKIIEHLEHCLTLN